MEGCPLCRAIRSTSSWAGITEFAGERFTYRRCAACGSLYCTPMPDEHVLAKIYGPGYADLVTSDHPVEDPKQPERLLGVLRAHPCGVFVDFGCGTGRLVEAAAALGWDARGVEFAGEVADLVSERTGRPVRTLQAVADAGHPPQADVIHVGDVIEHLTDLDQQFGVALAMLRPGGLLVVQGPLENNWTVFAVAKRALGRARPNRLRRQPPTHVLQATAGGQRGFFARHGLEEQTFEVFEVWWPAPSRIADCQRRPRLIALHLIRRASLILARVTPRGWGDRYFYVGRKPV
ncbi:MAG: class I SAM-dependent methyltransferase [Acidimicrobiales bacterium]